MHIAFLITAHVPYVRRAGRQPIGEDDLHTQIVRTLIPLVGLLGDLQATGLNPRVALALSPLLTEQLADPVVQKHFVLWMEEVIQRREEDMRRFEQTEEHHGAYLARFYLEWNRQALRSFEERHDRNLLLKFRELTAARIIEPLAGAASYAYLPLLEEEATVRAQIEHGVLHTNRRMGRPEGFWLPGCGWRPGLETIMAEVGLRYVVVDPSSLPDTATAVHQPAWVLPHRLAAIFLDDKIAQHIWSAELGYSGDPLYRDPDAPGGYMAIGTHPGQPYDPYHALRRAQEHANHFVSVLVEESVRRPADDLLVIPLDADLIGARWFEGPTWLQAVLTRCATHPSLELTTPAEYLRTRRPQQSVTLQPGSWAADGHAAWDGPGAAEYWQAVHAAERRIVALAERIPSANEEHERALNQAARELMLAQTSDWPVQLSAAGAGEGTTRWRTYLTRFAQLAEIAEHGTLSAGDRFLLEQLEELDGPFPNLNYRIFAP
jgi:1,4-alpha-glucan branching enzyme